MQRLIAISYLLIWVVFIAFTIIMTPYWTDAVLLPVFLLLALGAWLYGRTIGYLFVLLGMIHTCLITTVIHGDLITYYENRFSGSFLGIAVAFLVGNLRSSYNALTSANHDLDHRVAECNSELNDLTFKLIDDVEVTRIRHAQTLHDGIGQQLTGIQLYCASLEEQLVDNSNPTASLAYSIRTRAEEAHGIIRKTARMLFPVRMQETGLIPAINELASCFNEMEHLSIDVAIQGDFGHISEKLALALYRICHESVMCAATGLGASTIHLVIYSIDAGDRMTVRHNGTPWLLLKDSMEQRLIQYRLHTLGGQLSVPQSIGNTETIIYRIPGTE